VTHLILINAYASGRDFYTLIFAADPDENVDPEEAKEWSALFRASMEPDAMLAFRDGMVELDVTDLLPQIRIPALVLCHPSRDDAQPEMSQVLASRIPGARLIVLGPRAGDGVDVERHRTIEEFLGDDAPLVEAAAVPATSAPAAAPGMAVVLFTDIVDSTALTERLGDTIFRTASRALDEGMRAAMREAGGTPVEGKVLGDGVMGVFTSASQAIVAARRCIELSAETELRLHVGLHAGDVLHEAGNVYGGAVNIASRICGLSAPGEILVSGTVRELARTSAGVTFADRGKHALKGIDDAVRVYEVRWRD
jgi:class 3 adenylate cyclase